MTYVHRELEKEIIPYLERKEVLSIIGPRQVGKTTFLEFLEKNLKEKGKKVKFITFEKRSDLELFQESIEDFKDLVTQYQCVIIDEFQYAKEGGQKLKYLYDTTKVKFIISGSSSLELSFKTGKYMVGRMLDFKLSPFSFKEYLSFKDGELYELIKKRVGSQSVLKFNLKKPFGKQINQKLTNLLEEYVTYGGYPAVALSKTNKEKKKVLENIVEKYILRDIKGLLGMTTENELIKIAKLLASQIGNMVNYGELSNVSGLNYKKVIEHLNVLEKTFIINLIKPFFTNRRLELTKNPKSYFIDLGIRNFLLSDFRSLENRNDSGSVMENYAHGFLNNLVTDLKYWRTKSKAEVDFIIEKEQTVCPIEIKYTSRKIVGKSFHSFINKFNPELGIILTKDYFKEEKIKNTKVKFIPLSYF